MVTRLVAVLAMSAGCLVVGRAGAEPTLAKVKLRYSAPSACPDDLELVGAVEQFLGQPLRDAREQQLAIDVRVHEHEGGGYSATLSFFSSQGSIERQLEHPDCAKLGEAAALLIALAVDPERVKARQESAASQVASVAEAPAAPPLAPVARVPAPAAAAASAQPIHGVAVASRHNKLEKRTLRPSVTLLGLAGGGMLPSAAPGIGAELGLRFGFVEAGFGARYWLSRSAAVPGRPDSRVDVSLLTAGLRACGVPTWGAWLLMGCARADLGSMSGVGQQVDNARTRSDRFASLGSSLALGRTLGRLTPLGGVDLFWAASRPRFGVLNDGEPLQAFRPKMWGLLGFVGLTYAL